jgi:hypothetical protein
MSPKLRERLGLTKPPKLAMDQVSTELRTSVWNFVHDIFIHSNILALIESARVIAHQLRWQLDQITNAGALVDRLKGTFLSQAQGLEFYEILETVAQGMRGWSQPRVSDAQYWALWNRVLADDGAFFRFNNGELVPLTSEVEIAEVNRALSADTPGVAAHISAALKLMPPARDANLRNAVKEAISAVEAAIRYVTNEHKLTLGDALPEFEKKFGQFHPAFRGALMKLYGYTSDAGGIRHSLVEGSEPVTVDDARLMIVVCSAFANYLVARASDAKAK